MQNLKRLSKAEQILYMAENGEPSNDQVLASLLQGVTVEPVDEMANLVTQLCGEQYEKMFMDLLLESKIPSQDHEREILANFFRGRKDIISIECFKKIRND